MPSPTGTYITKKIATSRHRSPWFQSCQQASASSSAGTAVISPVTARSTFSSTGTWISSGLGPSGNEEGTSPSRTGSAGAASGRSATDPVGAGILSDLAAPARRCRCGGPPAQGRPPPQAVGGTALPRVAERRPAVGESLARDAPGGAGASVGAY